MVSAKTRLRRNLEITAASAAVYIAARLLAHSFWAGFYVLGGLAFVSFIMGAVGAIYHGVKVALAPRETKPSQTSIVSKECPDCAETILAEARVCKHCRYRFADKPTDLKPAGDPDEVVDVESVDSHEVADAVCPHCFAEQDVLAGNAKYICWRCKKVVSL